MPSKTQQGEPSGARTANASSATTAKGEVVVVGLGQMGSVFAHAFLKAGLTVHPVNRDTDIAELAARVPEPALCMVTVGEGDLDSVLAQLPQSWRTRVGLLQNELLPRSWHKHGVVNPTVAVVWFEKKKTIATTVILPTPVAGPKAALVADSLGAIGAAAEIVGGDGLVPALVAKNLYILVANCAGLQTGGTVGDLFENHRPLVDAVAAEVLAIQQGLVGQPLDSVEVMAVVERAVAADPNHGARGRSAPARLKRAIAHADELGIDVPKLRTLASAHSG